MGFPSAVKPHKPHRQNVHARNRGMSPDRKADTTVGIVTRAPIAMIGRPVAVIAAPCAKAHVVAAVAFADARKATYRPDHHPNAPRPHRWSLKAR